jgi:uncharacterized protein YndB with AHSA1/START domain
MPGTDNIHGKSLVNLKSLGLDHTGEVHYNLSVPELVEAALRRGEGKIATNGAFVAVTAPHTGRSPRDKFIVRDPETENKVHWGKVNEPMNPATFDHLANRVTGYLQGRELFVFDGYAGSEPRYRLPIRVVTEEAWHALFATQLFIKPSREEWRDHQPEFTVLAAPHFKALPENDGTRSETFICLNFTRKLIIIGGTRYAGEIKKSIFSVMNYLLPERGIFPMHCSANMGDDGHTSIFFGLSGTGKTTLSADPERRLIGDDEHGWSDHGVFNFEGGCYAKCIRLRKEREPQIYDAIKFGSVIENVVLDERTRVPYYDDERYTENTRCAYPLDYIDNAQQPSVGGHPNAIIFLTCDAFGVLPPHQQAGLQPGDVSLPVGLHGQAGRHRARRHRAQGDVLHLLRRALPAAGPRGLRAASGREDRQAQPAGLPGQHGLVRGALRTGRAHPPSVHPPHDEARPGGQARQRRIRDRPHLWPKDAQGGRWHPDGTPQPPHGLEEPRRIRVQGQAPRDALHRKLRALQGRGRGCPRRGAQSPRVRERGWRAGALGVSRTPAPPQAPSLKLRFSGLPRPSGALSVAARRKQFMPNTVRFHRVLRAAPERVYRAFLDSDAKAKWSPPNGFTGKVHHNDIKVGGGYKMSFTNFTTGKSHSFGGKYVELVPNERIRVTDTFDDPNLPGEMTVTATFKKVSVGTELTIVQEGLPDVIPPDGCVLGWQESLTLLALLVEAEIPE